MFHEGCQCGVHQERVQRKRLAAGFEARNRFHGPLERGKIELDKLTLGSAKPGTHVVHAGQNPVVEHFFDKQAVQFRRPAWLRLCQGAKEHQGDVG